jgi:hypothetical protein
MGKKGFDKTCPDCGKPARYGSSSRTNGCLMVLAIPLAIVGAFMLGPLALLVLLGPALLRAVMGDVNIFDDGPHWICSNRKCDLWEL